MNDHSLSSVRGLTDRALLTALQERASYDDGVEAELLALLAEVDARQLHLDLGYSSLYEYCIRKLHLTEWVAYHRIRVARAARDFPVILDCIRAGEIHLSAAKLLAPRLTRENHRELLALATHKTKAEIEELLADRAPKPDAPSFIRRLPSPAVSGPGSGGDEVPGQASLISGPGPSGTESVALLPGPNPAAAPAALSSEPVPATHPAPRRDPKPAPLGGGRFKVQFTAGPELHAKLREAQALLRHQIPNGDPARIIDKALTLLLADVKRKKFAKTSRPRSKPKVEPKTERPNTTRHVPAAIKREAVARVEPGCSYVSPEGRRCGSQDFLEFEHTRPWARHQRHRADEIQLYCRAHNQYAAEREYGRQHMQRCRKPRTGSGTSSRAEVRTGSGTSSRGEVNRRS